MQGLNTLFQSDPLAQEVGLAQIMQERQKNNLGMDRMRQQMGFDQQMNPLKLEEQSLGNQTAKAKLPGIFTANEDAALDLDKKKQTQAATIDDLLKGYKSKDSQRDLAEIKQAGEAFRQGAQYMRSIPGPLRKEFGKRLMGKYWQPEFDNFGEDYLVQMMAQIGNDMGEAEAKFMQQLRLQDDKQAFIEAENAKKLAAQERIAQFKTSLQEKLAQYKQQGKDPKTYQEMSVRLWQEAQNISDPEQKAAVLQQAQEFAQLFQTAIMLRAQAAQAGQVDAGALGGIPVKPPPTMGNVPGAVPVQPTVPLGAPQAGGAADRRVTVVSPDGKRGSIPASQLQQAIQQGYKEVK